MPREDDTDVWCDGDLRPDMPEVSGRSLLLQDLRNRLETAAGTLAWDPQGEDYGFDLRTLVNSKVRDISATARRVKTECEKDERVERAEVSIEGDSAEGRYRARIRIFDENGSFDFTLAVTQLTVELLLQGP